MKWIAIALAAVALFIAFRLRNGPADKREFWVGLDQIGSAVDALQATGGDGSFAQFTTVPLSDDEEAPFIQFSIEGGRIGLDWVLYSDANLRYKSEFEEFLDAVGAPYRELEMGEVRYLRTEDDRSAELCRRFLEEHLNVTDGMSLGLFVESFEWQNDD